MRGPLNSIGKSLAFLSVWTLLLPLATSLAHADSDTSLHLSISPVTINLQMNPGTHSSQVLQVKNDGANTERIHINLEKFTARDTGGTPKITPFEATDDFAHWISFSDSLFILGPGETKQLTATFSPPQDSAFSYDYAIEFVRAAPSAINSPTTDHLAGAVSILALLDVNSRDSKHQAAISNFKPTQSWYEFLPVGLVTSIKNTGNLHTVVHGNIFIKQGDSKIATLDVNNQSGSILPGTTRDFTSSWSDGFPVFVDKIKDGQVVTGSDGQPEKELKWDLSQLLKIRFGQYNAHALLVYDDGTRDVPIEADTSFWVIPWRLVLIALAILLLPILLGFAIGKFSSRRAKRQVK